MRVEADEWSPGAGTDPSQAELPLSRRSFDIGFTAEGPMDISEPGRACLVETAARTADVLNVFFAVRWCKLGQDSCAADPIHAMDLETVRAARRSGLKLALTFDFTHGTPEDTATIGDLNPRPDGSSPGTLLDDQVRQALVDELLWLIAEARPEYVMVGIEVDILQERHPDWWGAFVDIQHTVYDAIKTLRPATHVTAYHRISWSVDTEGRLVDSSAALWRQLRGGIDSVAYSIYPNTALPDVSPGAYPAGYFSRPADIAPELPIMIPELGMSGGEGASYSQAEQALVLQTMLEELAAIRPVAVIWFQLYDRLYLGSPQWAQEAFNFIGMHDLSGTPKQSFAIWQRLHQLDHRQPHPRRPGGRH